MGCLGSLNPHNARLTNADAQLEAIAKETRDEPKRIRALYKVQATRIEPVGIVYLWPLSA